MNNKMLQAAQRHLMQKYKQESTRDLYKHFLTQPTLFTSQTLKQEQPMEQLYKLVFIGSHFERKNSGFAAKQYVIDCLKQYKQNIIPLQVEEIAQILISLGNTLIVDDVLIQSLVQEIQKVETSSDLKLILSLYHAFYKLSINNLDISSKLEGILDKRRNEFHLSDYISYLYVLSNKYAMGECSLDTLLQVADLYRHKLNTVPKHSYYQKTAFQFSQFMFNIFPELIKQNDMHLIHPNESNPFKHLFQAFRKDYIISRMIIDRRLPLKQIEYYESQAFSNVFKLKDDYLTRQVSEFEKNIEILFNDLNMAYETRKNITIYEVDFYSQGVVVNCNGQSHFIEDLDGNILGMQPNFIMQQRHLETYGVRKIINIDYQEWCKIDPRAKQLKVFAKYFE